MIKKLFKTPAFIISVVLFVMSAILLFCGSPIVKVNFSDEYIAYINNICIGLATGMLGIIVTITFVQVTLDKQTTKNEKIEEYKKIIRYSKYAQILIAEYIAYYNQVVTPTDRRSKISYGEFVKDFKLEDMSGMYESTWLMKDAFYTPVIKMFYEAENELSAYFLRMNEEIDFKYSENLECILHEFFRNSKSYDVRNNILGAQHMYSGAEKVSELIVKELRNPSKDYLLEYQEGRLNSNLMTTIVILLYFLNAQKKCIEEYLQEINRIEKELYSITEYSET